MGKRTSGRAKGKGSLTYRVRKRAFIYRIGYPKLSTEGKAKIVKLINSLAHTTPLAVITIADEKFYSPCADGLYEGQEIEVGGKEVKNGNILVTCIHRCGGPPAEKPETGD